jgi:two-component system chemotaxis sensor kinase CheA
MNEMDDVVKEFLVESHENLDRLDRDFVELETNPTAHERIGSIFRTIHTIKGTCGFLGFGKLESVAHVGENLLCRLRDQQLTVNTDIISGLLKLVDTVREILRFIETTQTEGDKDYSAVVELLKRLNDSSPSSETAANPVETPVEQVHAPAAAIQETGSAETPAPVEVHAAAEVTAPAVAEKPHPAADLHADPAETAAGKDGNSSVAGNAIRVDVGLLDKLMNLVGELVLARNQVLQHTSKQQDAALTSTTQRLNLITSELQESVMKTRMQPIAGLWNKFPRVVRDLSQSCHKKIRLEMEGKETELDKTILEAIKDPLTHIIRNSVDHGVESPEVRVAKGKSEEGVLFMRAFHEGGQVNIEIIDDGGGIDPERVKRKALEKGLITADQAARMGDREAIALIFLPGFSTAEKVTNVSGRGVGMDVVKTNVEKIGGTVDVQSTPGQGTTLRIKIPLTLAIIPALIVTTGGERFAIPQVSLLELVRLDGGDDKIETIHGAPIYRLRGKLLPLVHLNRVLKLQTDAAGAGTSSTIVVLRAGEQQFGLVVEQVNDTEEIVVKPLGKQLKTTNVFAGATIMGDGRVALILDVMGVAQNSNVISTARNHDMQQAAENARSAASERQSLLLFSLRGNRRMVIPLALVSRVEELERSSVELAGTQQVVQYRGQIMPLINLADVLTEPRKSHARQAPGAERPAKDPTLQVVVISHGNRDYGLRVQRILDVVEEQVTLQVAATRRGVKGTAVIKNKVTEIVDIAAVVEMAERLTAVAA